jgi:predicted RND superfamily exporter protein
MSKFDSLAVTFARQVLKFKWLVLLMSVLVVGGFAAGVQHLGFSTNYRVFFSSENPQLVAFEEFQNIYTKSDTFAFILKAKQGDMFTPKHLEAVQYLTKRAWQIPYSIKVDSITNYQHTFAEEDDLMVVDLVEEAPSSYTQQELNLRKNIAVNEPTIIKRLISEDARTTNVNVTLQFQEKDPLEVPKAMAKAREIMAEVEAKYPYFETALSGTAAMNNAFMESSMKDMNSLVPIMYAVLLIVMMIFLRSILGTIATLFVIAFSAMAGMGFGGWAGFPLTPPSSMAPTIILTLAIADSVHILVTMFKEMGRGRTRDEAIVESLRVNMSPVIVTSITTAIGFLSLNFSDAPPFHHLGNMSAVGVLMALFLSMTLLPALLSILPIKSGYAPKEKSGLMHKFGEWVVAKHKPIFVVMVASVVVLVAMIPRLDLNDEFVQYFDKSVDFRNDTDFMIENLTGIYTMEFSIGAENSGGVSEPDYLKNVEKFSNWLRGQDEVMHVYDMTDVYRRLNKSMHGDNQAYYKLPEDRELAAQYMLLYEMSLPYGLDLNDRINVDKSATRLTATLQDLSTVDTRAFKAKAEAWMKDNLPSYMQATATSPVVMFSYISERNINSMSRGNVVALLLISLTIGFALKSARLGSYSLVPNLVPAGMAFGVWALLVGQVNMAVAIVAAVSLGIIVDDTVHFLSKYDRARREKGYSAKQAVMYAFDTVGTALVVTTVTLVAGFGILTFSSFQINNTMGALTALSIFLALVVDFLLLPAMLIMLDKRDMGTNAKATKAA